MAGLLKKTLQLLTGSENVSFSGMFRRTKPTERELIQRESEIGGHLFGAVPAGHHRQFFNVDPTTWVWYEEWVDDRGKHQTTTTRYEVHENGILKVQEGAHYYYIEGYELQNLVSAIRIYYERVTREIYRRDPVTGKHLAAA
ncbi:hypothetical protein KC953_01575 [Candidatus Saccharibacteria bacterium]|nr:hypothetical protein [Candidatus Saccharibacteria bacterium]